MGTAIQQVTPGAMERYRTAARRREQRERATLAEREQRAWDLARQAGNLLRERFHASRVVVFGSLVHTGSFTPWSDVDVAAWGIDPVDTLPALGAVLDLDAEIEVNLIDIMTCSESMLNTINQDGIDV